MQGVTLCFSFIRIVAGLNARHYAGEKHTIKLI